MVRRNDSFRKLDLAASPSQSSASKSPEKGRKRLQQRLSKTVLVGPFGGGSPLRTPKSLAREPSASGNKKGSPAKKRAESAIHGHRLASEKQSDVFLQRPLDFSRTI